MSATDGLDHLEQTWPPAPDALPSVLVQIAGIFVARKLALGHASTDEKAIRANAVIERKVSSLLAMYALPSGADGLDGVLSALTSVVSRY